MKWQIRRCNGFGRESVLAVAGARGCPHPSRLRTPAYPCKRGKPAGLTPPRTLARDTRAVDEHLNRTPHALRLARLSAARGHGRALTQIAASDLDVPVLGQLTPPQLPLGELSQRCPLQVVRFNAALGGRCLPQEGLEHAPGYPHHAAVFTDFNAKLNSLPLGIPSGVIGKGEEHRSVGLRAKPTTFSICSTATIQQQPCGTQQNCDTFRAIPRFA